jgi:hypothetical protein
VRLIATDGFGSESGVVGEPAHVGGVVECFVSRETKGGSSIEDEYCILLMSHDDVGSGVAGSRKRKSPDVVGRRLSAVDHCVVASVGNG